MLTLGPPSRLQPSPQRTQRCCTASCHAWHSVIVLSCECVLLQMGISLVGMSSLLSGEGSSTRAVSQWEMLVGMALIIASQVRQPAGDSGFTFAFLRRTIVVMWFLLISPAYRVGLWVQLLGLLRE